MFKKIAAATALILASSAALAAQPGSFYAGADIGQTKVEDFHQRETGYGAFVGYNFHENFAVEAGLRRLADYELFIGAPSGSVEGEQRVNQAHLSVVASLPVAERLSVFGRLGVNRLDAKVSGPGYSFKHGDNKALYGVGMSYALTPAVSARVEVQKPASDATTVNAGVAFQF